MHMRLEGILCSMKKGFSIHNRIIELEYVQIKLLLLHSIVNYFFLLILCEDELLILQYVKVQSNCEIIIEHKGKLKISAIFLNH